MEPSIARFITNYPQTLIGGKHRGVIPTGALTHRLFLGTITNRAGYGHPGSELYLVSDVSDFRLFWCYAVNLEMEGCICCIDHFVLDKDIESSHTLRVLLREALRFELIPPPLPKWQQILDRNDEADAKIVLRFDYIDTASSQLDVSDAITTVPMLTQTDERLGNRITAEPGPSVPLVDLGVRIDMDKIRYELSWDGKDWGNFDSRGNKVRGKVWVHWAHGSDIFDEGWFITGNGDIPHYPYRAPLLRIALAEAHKQGHDIKFGANLAKLLAQAAEDEKEYINVIKETTVTTSAKTNPETVRSGKFKDVTVETSQDEQIRLPVGMSIPEAQSWLAQILENESQKIMWESDIDAFPLDAALALSHVLQRRYGSAVKSGRTVPTFFGEKEAPPFMVAVQTGLDTVEYVPWGYFQVPAMPDQKITCSVGVKNDQMHFILAGEILRKYKPVLDAIAEEVRAEVKVNSIYRGKAFRISFPDPDGEFADPTEFAPKFIQLAKDDEKLILATSTNEQIETNVFTPVEHTEACRQSGIPIKRGVLLAGHYGVGKTLTAAVLARKCVENGWTFIYLENVEDFSDAYRFARRYEPAVIFAEDIDSVMSEYKKNGGRSEVMNDVLNTLDGVDSKGSEIMSVFTTNFLDNIDQAMLRPGRLDAVVIVEPPDPAAVLQLIRHYSRGLLDHEADTNLAEVCELLSGQIPAIIRESVERSKLAAVRRTNSGNPRVTADDVLVSAKGMLAHLKLLAAKPIDTRSEVVKAADRAGAWNLLRDMVVNGNQDDESTTLVLETLRGELPMLPAIKNK